MTGIYGRMSPQAQRCSGAQPWMEGSGCPPQKLNTYNHTRQPIWPAISHMNALNLQKSQLAWYTYRLCWGRLHPSSYPCIRPQRGGEGRSGTRMDQERKFWPRYRAGEVLWRSKYLVVVICQGVRWWNHVCIVVIWCDIYLLVFDVDSQKVLWVHNLVKSFQRWKMRGDRPVTVNVYETSSFGGCSSSLCMSHGSHWGPRVACTRVGCMLAKSQCVRRVVTLVMTAQTMSFRYELACEGHSTKKAQDLVT